MKGTCTSCPLVFGIARISMYRNQSKIRKIEAVRINKLNKSSKAPLFLDERDRRGTFVLFLIQRHTSTTYNNDRKKKNCAMDTTPPIKNPTAMELWNFLIIMVPPIDNMRRSTADQMDMNPSASPRVPVTAKDMSASTPVMARMEYLYHKK